MVRDARDVPSVWRSYPLNLYAIFRTNNASNYLPLEGRLPRDRDRIVETVDRALANGIAQSPEWARGLW